MFRYQNQIKNIKSHSSPIANWYYINDIPVLKKISLNQLKSIGAKKEIERGNTLIKLEKLSNPTYYRVTYFDLIENEIISSYGSPNFQDVIFDIKETKYGTGGGVGKYEYKTINTRSASGLKEAERLKAEGWKIISTGFDTIQFERLKTTKKMSTGGSAGSNNKMWSIKFYSTELANPRKKQSYFIRRDVIEASTRTKALNIAKTKHKDFGSLISIQEVTHDKNGNLKYNTGGGAGSNTTDMNYNEILAVLKEKLDDAVQELPNDYEQSYDAKGEEVEHQSRDGFIAFTDGGYEVTWFEYMSMFHGAGRSLPTKNLDQEMQRQIDYNYQIAKERFVEEYPEIVEELGEDNIDYHSLYEAGYGSEAEQLSEWEMDFDGNETIMCEIGAYYYTPDNYRSLDGQHTIRLFGYVNLESPYHRRGNLDDSYDIDITFDSISELKEKVDAGLKEIIDWFDGKYYNDSTTEMKIRRMEEGGFMDGVYAKGGGVSPFKNMMETNTITEKEINLIKLRMNNDKVDDFTQEAIDFIWDNSPQLTSDQNKKGIDYLRNLWKSPTGKERVNSPFGYREENVLETFEYFELRGFYDAGNQFRKFYVPLYTCVGTDSSFEYAFYGGKVNILG